MSSSSFASGSEEQVVLYEAPESSESSEPPMNEWSSLYGINEFNLKKTLFQEGLYDPGDKEICAVYLAASDSSVAKHQYSKYPCVEDPGIEDALLLAEPRKKYADDGQDLYLDLCKEMNLAPIRLFHKGLLSSEINLKYYGVNPASVKAMTMALSVNNTVTRLDLTSCRFSYDACYHIGELLGDNHTLKELILDGCKIKSNGLQRLVSRMMGRQMELLDLSDNEIKDEGFKYLSYILLSMTVIKRLYLRKNDLTSETGLELARVLEINKTFTHLDLSCNAINSKEAVTALMNELSWSEELMEFYMSWNTLAIDCAVLWRIFRVPSLKVFNVSDNKLSNESIRNFKLEKAKELVTLDLSRNPFTPQSAYRMVSILDSPKVKVKNFLLEDINVSKDFAVMIKQVLALPFRQNTVVKYGTVLRNYTLTMPDMRDIVMKRLLYLTTLKKCELDIALFFLQAAKEVEFMDPKNLFTLLKAERLNIDEDLTNELALAFPGPKTKSGAIINIAKVVEYVHRIWPDKKLPPTPPPEPPVPGKKAKNKKKKERARAA